MKRFTICGLRAFVDFVNDTVPKIYGKHFEVQSECGYYRIILKGDGGKYGNAAKNTHYKGGNPRECVHAFRWWLFDSTCPLEEYTRVVEYITKYNI